MHHLIRVIAGATAITIGLLICDMAYESLTLPAAPESHLEPPHIQAIRELADLTVLEVELSDIATGSVNGRTGGTTAVMLVRGTAAIGVDLEQAYFVSVDEERQSLIIALPHPEVQRVALSVQASQILSCERAGLWQIVPGDALEDRAIKLALAYGEERLAAAASENGFHDRARQQAVSVLRRFIHQLGWSLEIRWE